MEALPKVIGEGKKENENSDGYDDGDSDGDRGLGDTHIMRNSPRRYHR
jgi:hypothetical protein